MAGRIRSLKPELLDDEQVAELSDTAWRLWISMRLLADDHGNLRSGARYLAALVWQNTARASEIPDLLDELVDARRVQTYEADGQRYLHLVGWETEQRIDNAGKPRLPLPPNVGPNNSVRLPETSPRVSATVREIPLARAPGRACARNPAAGSTIPTTTTITDPEIPPGAHARSNEHDNGAANGKASPESRGVGIFDFATAAWSQGVSDATGKPCPTPTAPWELRGLDEIARTHGPKGASAEELLAWLARDARAFVVAAAPTYVTVKAYIAWVSGGRQDRASGKHAIPPGARDHDDTKKRERRTAPAIVRALREAAEAKAKQEGTK